MTDHPLTDDIIRYDKKLGCHDLGAWVYTENDLRAAADWQLEQVTEWLRNNLVYEFEDEQDRSHLIADLKKAMRPTTQENN